MLALNKRHHDLVTTVRSNEAVIVQPTAAAGVLMLPGDTQAIQQIPVNARVDGYLAQRYVDIGDHVKKSQLLAVIDTPELDQQVVQGRADLATQRANSKAAKANYFHWVSLWHAATATVVQTKASVDFDELEIKRYEYLAQQGAIPWETRDTFLRQVRADRALLKSNQENEASAKSQVDAALDQVKAAEQTVLSSLANLNRLLALQGFRNVVAPYDGVITSRFVDVGSLIQSGGTGTQILAMARLDVLRIFVQVPQTVYRTVKQGDPADVIVPEFPDRVFRGSVTNVAGALDQQSRTLQVEIRVDNRDYTLPAGVYSLVRLKSGSPVTTVTIPVNAISARGSGQYIVKVANGHAHFQAIEIFRDNGPTVEVSSGARAGDIILLDPPDDLKENEPVKPVIEQLNFAPS